MREEEEKEEEEEPEEEEERKKEIKETPFHSRDSGVFAASSRM